jgi:hypothetical protein
MGRTEVPGMVPGSHLRVEGTPSMEGDTLIMLNPFYEFVILGNPWIRLG